MRRAGYAAIVLILGLAACTSDGGSSPSGAGSTTRPATPIASTTPATPTPTPSVATTGPNVRPGEKPPVLDAAGRTNTRAGAVLFATYWFKALDWGYATTDSTLAKSLFLPACTDCARFMSNYDTTRSKGQHFVGGRSVISSKRVVSDDERHPGSTVVDVRLSIAPLRAVDSAGRTVDSAPAVPELDYRLWLAWQSKGWAVLDTKEVDYR